MREGFASELDGYLQNLKDQFGLLCSSGGAISGSHMHRFEVLDALVNLFCRSNISAETLWDGGWLLRQLLPYSEVEFSSHHLKLLKDSYNKCVNALMPEIKGIWSDLLITVICDEWKRCKRAIEAASPQKEPKSILLSTHKSSSDDSLLSESSLNAGERMCESVKVFVLLHQLEIFSLGKGLPDQPLLIPAADASLNSRANAAGLDTSGPKPGMEIRLVDAVPCRISFERGKERHFCFLAISLGTSGWVLLAEEFPQKQHYGTVRVAAPLAGSNPMIDDKHTRWLHLRIRPSTLPFMEPAKSAAYGKMKAKGLVDGRWTLAFWSDEACKLALSMILEEMKLQSNEVERRLKPLLDLDSSVDSLNSLLPLGSSPLHTPSNSL